MMVYTIQVKKNTTGMLTRQKRVRMLKMGKTTKKCAKLNLRPNLFDNFRFLPLNPIFG